MKRPQKKWWNDFQRMVCETRPPVPFSWFWEGAMEVFQSFLKAYLKPIERSEHSSMIAMDTLDGVQELVSEWFGLITAIEVDSP